MFDLIIANATSPAVLFFVLGLLAAKFRSDLKIPEGLNTTLSIYLLIAIGLKGGIELSQYPVSAMGLPIAGGLLLGILIPIITVAMLTGLKVERKNALALAAAYGSVSIVTFGAGAAFLDKAGIAYEGYMSAIVAVMEIPAIVVSMIMVNKLKSGQASGRPTVTLQSRILPALPGWFDLKVLRESLMGKSVLLLLGSPIIGRIGGEAALPAVKPLFIDMYKGFLLVFLLSMGLMCGQKLSELKTDLRLLGFALLGPALFGILGVVTGQACGLSLGGATLMGVLAGSASYIAAPAALRTFLPEVNPSLYLGLALGFTFPFNLLVGVPLYYFAAVLLVQ